MNNGLEPTKLYPNNSELTRKKKNENNIPLVAQGSIVPPKKSLGKKFLETFVMGSASDVWEYLLMDTIVPGIKHALEDMLRMFLYQDSRGERYNRGSDRSRVWTSYDTMSTSRTRGREERRSDEIRQARRTSVNLVEDVLFEHKSQAQEILGDLIARCQEYDSVSVNDFYVMAGLETDYTKRKYGWYEKDLDRVEIIRIREGWLIKMPRPVILD